MSDFNLFQMIPLFNVSISPLSDYEFSVSDNINLPEGFDYIVAIGEQDLLSPNMNPVTDPIFVTVLEQCDPGQNYLQANDDVDFDRFCVGESEVLYFNVLNPHDETWIGSYEYYVEKQSDPSINQLITDPFVENIEPWGTGGNEIVITLDLPPGDDYWLEIRSKEQSATNSVPVLPGVISFPIPIEIENCDIYTVTNTNWGGDGSLYKAIQYANNHNGPDTILFDIPGNAPFVIEVPSGNYLPVLWGQKTVIDGTSQEAYYPGAIEIKSEEYHGDAGFYISADQVELYGLKISDFQVGVIYNGGSNLEGIIGAPGRGNIFYNNYGGIYMPHYVNPSIEIMGNEIIGSGEGTGITMQLSNDNIVGGILEGEGNIIYGFETGIDNMAGTNNIVRGNSLYCNSISGMNPTTTTAPEIVDVSLDHISGSTLPNAIVDVYLSINDECQDIEVCQGSFLMGSVVANGQGEWQLNAPFNQALVDGDRITATATIAGHSTSSFAPCYSVSFGCTSIFAHNYNSEANVDDGTCLTCQDGIQNGDETETDCGGDHCWACGTSECEWSLHTIGRSDYINDIDMVDEQTIYAVGMHEMVVKSEDGGQSWSTLYSTNDFSAWFGCYFLDHQTGYVVGSQGQIMKTTDSGLNWTLQNSGTTVQLYDIWFSNETDGWVCGQQGTLLKTNNGGNTWQEVETGTNESLTRLQFFNTGVGYIIGNNGTFLKSIDGGNSWLNQTIGLSTSIRGICFITEDVGWISGYSLNVILKTEDGGNNWTLQYNNDQTILTEIKMLDQNRGMVVGHYGTVLLTNDGGETWDPFQIPINTSIGCLDQIENTWVGGTQGAIFKRICPADPFIFNRTNSSGVFLGMAQVDGIGAESGDWIAAFDEENNCAGAAMIDNEEGSFELEIFGDDPVTTEVDEGIGPNESFILELFDKSEEEYLSHKHFMYQVYFENWSDEGGDPLPDYSDPELVYDFFRLKVDSIALNEGWNLISTDVLPLDSSILYVFSTLEEGNLKYITGYNEGATLYDPTIPDFLNTLNNINKGYGYWVKVNQVDTLKVAGFPIDEDFAITYNEGWNLIAYLPQSESTPDSHFADLIAQDILLFLSGFQNGVEFYDPSLPPFLNTLEFLKNGLGYWLKVSEGNNFVVEDLNSRNNRNKSNIYDFVIGYSDLKQRSGEKVYIVDSNGEIIAEMPIHEDGYLMTTPVYSSDREPVLQPGEKLLFKYQGKLLDPGINFSGDQSVHRVTLLFNTNNNIPELLCFPNPFGNIFEIKIVDLPVGKYTLNIFDIEGHLLLEEALIVLDELEGITRKVELDDITNSMIVLILDQSGNRVGQQKIINQKNH